MTSIASWLDAHLLLRGTAGLVLTYLLFALPMLAAMLWRGASARHFIVWPVVAAAGASIAALLASTLGFIVTEWLRWPGGPLSGAALTASLGVAMGWTASAPRTDAAHQRGTVILDGSDAQRETRRLRRRHGADLLTLAGVALDGIDETKHFKLIGTTGSGKSTAIRELLGQALARGDRALIADPDGGYRRVFFDASRGDRILNPFEPDSLRWDLFAEIEQPWDAEQLARSLVPDSGSGADREWRQYARVLLVSLVRQLWEANVRDTSELHRLITSAPIEELRILLGGTPAAPFVEESNARMFSSIRSVATTALAPLEFIAAQGGEGFSIRRWVRDGGGQSGALFLPYRASQIAALRGLISTWMRIAIFETMSLPERDHRLWFVVDELDALGTIDGLKDALARLRKFGGRCVLGFQSIAQVRSTYGDGDARTIVENCANTLILRCSASEGGGTAQFASQLIGEREIVRRHVTRSTRPGEWRASRSESEQHVTERAVLASEIEQLADLHGILKTASSPTWWRVALTPTHH
jgi:type IV secretory pathway TraG/TraD family ATPase VirD4